jgi:pyrroline-5-carboxylate reductase
VLSIAAGIAINQLEAALPAGQPVARAIPNTPAKIGRGITALAAGTHCTEEHLHHARNTLSAIGKVVDVQEADLDAVTAISGSGPAYVFYLTEALTNAGVKLGLNLDVATVAAVQAVAGAGPMLADTMSTMPDDPEGDEPTKAGILELEGAGYSQIVSQAAHAAAMRAAEITQEHDDNS